MQWLKNTDACADCNGTMEGGSLVEKKRAGRKGGLWMCARSYTESQAEPRLAISAMPASAAIRLLLWVILRETIADSRRTVRP